MRKTSKIIISIIVLILVILLLFLFFMNHKKGTHELILHARLAGSDIAGKPLPTEEKDKTYAIKKGDSFLEPSGGGLWLQNNTSTDGKDILEVVSFEEDYAVLKVKGNEVTLKYGESISVDTYYVVMDARSYYYDIQIKK